MLLDITVTAYFAFFCVCVHVCVCVRASVHVHVLCIWKGEPWKLASIASLLIRILFLPTTNWLHKTSSLNASISTAGLQSSSEEAQRIRGPVLSI